MQNNNDIQNMVGSIGMDSKLEVQGFDQEYVKRLVAYYHSIVQSGRSKRFARRLIKKKFNEDIDLFI